MNTIKKLARVFMLLFIVMLASILPVPIPYHYKDKFPKFLIEQVDKKEETEEEEIPDIS